MTTTTTSLLEVLQLAKVNQVQKTLLEQLKRLNPLYKADFGIENIVIMDDATLRFCARNKQKVNIDIHYNSGSDLYDIKAYHIVKFDAKTIFDTPGIFFDQLNDILRQIIGSVES